MKAADVTVTFASGETERFSVSAPHWGYNRCSVRLDGMQIDVTARAAPLQSLASLFEALGGIGEVARIVGVPDGHTPLIRDTGLLAPQHWQALLKSQQALAIGLTADHLVQIHTIADPSRSIGNGESLNARTAEESARSFRGLREELAPLLHRQDQRGGR